MKPVGSMGGTVDDSNPSRPQKPKPQELHLVV